MRWSASPGRATWASTCCITTCTRRSRRRTAAAGSGPVGVSEKLVDFLPGPIVDIEYPDDGDETPLYVLVTPKQSIGRMRAFAGNFGMFIRAYTYMRIP